MTDRYEKIRKALAMGPTPGPWEYDENADGSCPLVYGANETPVLKFDQGCPYDYDPSWDVRGVDAAYIAACDPDTIRELLAERDALRQALSRILENEASDWKAAEEFGGYVLDDELREEARAVLRREGWK